MELMGVQEAGGVVGVGRGRAGKGVGVRWVGGVLRERGR